MSLLTPAQRRRAQEFTAATTGSFVADINNEQGKTLAGPFIPPLMHASVVYSSALGRAATAAEHLVMQGIPAFAFLCLESHRVWPEFTERCRAVYGAALLRTTDIKVLAGNAMHAPCVGAVVAYALARACPRDPIVIGVMLGVDRIEDVEDDTGLMVSDADPKRWEPLSQEDLSSNI